MYTEFYGMAERPFTLLPDPDYLYFSKKHTMAKAMLEYGIFNLAGFTVITGEIGAGKTTLIHHLLNELNENVSVGLISHTHDGLGDLLDWILGAFGIEPYNTDKSVRYNQFVDFVIKQYSVGKRVLLIVDEAQNLDVGKVEELRVLSNLNAYKRQLIQVMLVGQPQLRDMLRRPELEQFAQRVLVDYHLDRLDHDEVREYVRHRIRRAGGERNLFDEAAFPPLAESSGGIPRLINVICDTALVYGYADQAKTISGDLLKAVIDDKRKGGILPLTGNMDGLKNHSLATVGSL